MTKYFSISCAAMYVVLLFSCQQKTKTTQGTSDSLLSVQKSPDFNEDTAYAFVSKQVSFGPRVPGTLAHENCLAYLETVLSRYKGHIFIQKGPVTTYDGKNYTLENVIAAFNSDKKQRVMLSAHWDARPFSDEETAPLLKKKPFDAANDGGSGVAVLLEVARHLMIKKPDIGVDIIFWDIEDYGKHNDEKGEPSWCLGSEYWAKHPPVNNYHPRYGINLDMVGGVGAAFYMEKASMDNAPEVVKKVWAIAGELGYSSFFPFEKLQSPIIDDHVRVNDIAGIPTIDILDYNDSTMFYKYWHKQGDNLSHIDKNVLKAVGQTVMETVYRER